MKASFLLIIFTVNPPPPEKGMGMTLSSLLRITFTQVCFVLNFLILVMVYDKKMKMRKVTMYNGQCALEPSAQHGSTVL